MNIENMKIKWMVIIGFVCGALLTGCGKTGPVCEYELSDALNSRRYAICYAVIMVAGGMLSARLHKKGSPFTHSIGASGVICGLLGIYMVIAFRVFGFGGIKSLFPTIVLLVAMTTSKRIDSIGNFTGLFVGIVCGIVLVSAYAFGF